MRKVAPSDRGLKVLVDMVLPIAHGVGYGGGHGRCHGGVG